MKKANKLLCFLLAAVMVMTMVVVVNADTTTYKITVTKGSSSNISISGNTYNAYKLFDVKYNGTSYAYSMQKTSPFYTNANSTAAIESYFDLKESTSNPGTLVVSPKTGVTINETTMRELADKLGNISGFLSGLTAAGSVTVGNDSDTADINLSGPGYYIVTGTATAVKNQAITSAVMLTTVAPEATVSPKADVPTITKVIVNSDQNNGTDGYGTAVDVGSVVTFKATSKVPNTTGYSSYEFVIHDTMTAGLTFKSDSVVVKIGETTLSANEYTVVTSGLSNNETFTVKIPDLLKKKDDKSRAYPDGTAITVTYSATLNDNALKTDVETNKIYLEYSNNPYDSSTKAKTPEKTVYVYDFDVEIDKYTGAKDTGTRLGGAKFILYKKDGDKKLYYKWNGTDKKVEWVEVADANLYNGGTLISTIDEVTTSATSGDTLGKACFKGLDAGTYYLVETKAPSDEYNELTDPVEVVISATYKSDGQINTSSAASTSKGQYIQTESIQNNTGAVLPGTGGIGTKIFYVLGLILVLGALVLLVTKRRVKYNK